MTSTVIRYTPDKSVSSAINIFVCLLCNKKVLDLTILDLAGHPHFVFEVLSVSRHNHISLARFHMNSIASDT